MQKASLYVHIGPYTRVPFARTKTPMHPPSPTPEPGIHELAQLQHNNHLILSLTVACAWRRHVLDGLWFDYSFNLFFLRMPCSGRGVHGLDASSSHANIATCMHMIIIIAGSVPVQSPTSLYLQSCAGDAQMVRKHFSPPSTKMCRVVRAALTTPSNRPAARQKSFKNVWSVNQGPGALAISNHKPSHSKMYGAWVNTLNRPLTAPMCCWHD